MKPTRKKPSGIFAVALGLAAAVASVGFLSDRMSAFAQNYPQPNVQVPVTNSSLMQNVAPMMQSQTVPADLLRESTRLLFAARISLAGGDVVTAEQQLLQAVALNAPYTAKDDRPEYVKQLIDGHKNWLAAQKTHGNTDQVRRMRAENLALQAEGFCVYNNLEMAEKLAQNALSQNVGASMEMISMQRDPQSILNRIRDAKIVRAVQDGTLVSSNSTTPVSPAVQHQAQEMQPRLAEARRLLQLGQIAEAEKIGLQLVGMKVPDSAFDANSDNPNRLMVDIAMTRHQMNGQTLGGVRQPTYNPTLDPTRNIPVQGELTPATVPGQMPTTVAPERAPAINGGDVSRQASEFEFAAEVQRQIVRSQQLMSEQLPKMDDAISNLQDVRTKIEAAEISSDMKRNLTMRVDRELVQMEDYRAKHGSQIAMAKNNADAYSSMAEEQKQNAYVEMKLKEYTDEYNVLYRQERYAEAAIVVEKAKAIAPKHTIVTQMEYQSMLADRQQTMNNLRNRREEGVWKAFRDQENSIIMNVDDLTPMVGPDSSFWTSLNKRNRIDTVGDEKTETEQRIYQILEQPITLNTGGRKPLRTVMDELQRQIQVNIQIENQAIVDANLAGDQETANSDIFVELNAEFQVKLKHALNAMLGQVGLAYTVRNETLYITTPERARAELKTKAYFIGDLAMRVESKPMVRPKSGMQRHKEAMDVALGRNTGFSVANPAQTPIQPVSMNNNLNNQSGMSRMPSNILAQTLDNGYRPGGYGGFDGNYGPFNDYGYGYDRTGSAGGGANFGELMMLIMQTVDPNSWNGMSGMGGMGMGGMGGQRSGRSGLGTGDVSSGSSGTSTEDVGATMVPFTLTQSLIIKQSEENHQKIADLLRQLRKMNDVQITVEVRFVSIEDNFFEQIGMDFDMAFRNSQSSKFAGVSSGTDGNASALSTAVKQAKMIAGLVGNTDPSAPPQFSNDLGISVNQSSYGLSVPGFGSFDPGAGASIGFAIMNDIETYFFLSAAQGDRRSNILQAPKVTMMNGQSNNISDSSERFFVTSLIPIVGEFSVAYQPVVEPFDEGTELYVQAVVSSDRRYVRMNIMPTFSTISDVIPTYDYRTGLYNTDSSNPNQSTADAGTGGGVVQQPVYSQFNIGPVAVSVPDGGTILMGGVKRLSEGRSEYGVPMVNKIPYLKRLFSNTAVGRSSTSLMMMATPHIIIQEEYEESMGTATETE